VNVTKEEKDVKRIVVVLIAAITRNVYQLFKKKKSHQK
jgi:hypothetical protein